MSRSWPLVVQGGNLPVAVGGSWSLLARSYRNLLGVVPSYKQARQWVTDPMVSVGDSVDGNRTDGVAPSTITSSSSSSSASIEHSYDCF